MRKILQSSVVALALLTSGIPTPQAQAATISLIQAQSPTASLQFDLTSPTAFATKSETVGDFNQTVAVPAKQKQIELITAQLKAAGLNPAFAATYLAASQATGTPWQVIAAVHKIETNQSGNTAVASSAGAQGPMQFMPGTYRAYAVDGNGDGTSNIYNATDAIFTGANYLRAGGAARGDVHSALFNYNHAEWYVTKVMNVAYLLGYK